MASGEQVTSGLLAIALQAIGVEARSWQGWQIPVRTDGAHGAARIASVDASPIVERYARGQVAVVAGFQGIAPEGRIATLGRGGSDTSAVALAAALDAERCDIYTDVDGVYTTDPRIVPEARRLRRVAYEEMLEMASLGAKVAAGALGRARHDEGRAHGRALVLPRSRRPRSGRHRGATGRTRPAL